MKYSSAHVAEYGQCKDTIHGDCGWGAENALLDKTGYHEYWIPQWFYAYGGSGKLIYKACNKMQACEKSKPAAQCTLGQVIRY